MHKNVCMQFRIASGFISLGANFPTLSFSRNLPNLEIHDPNIQEAHVSDTLHSLHVHNEHQAYSNRQDACL